MTKRVILAAVAVSMLSVANAQDERPVFGFSKGDVLLEGNIGFSSTKDNNAKESATGFALAPRAGYFISDKVALGVELLFSTDETKANDIKTDKNSQFGAAAFLRYHFLEAGKRFKPYTHLDAGFLSQKRGLADAKFSGFGATLDVGANYFITERIAINANFGDVLSFASVKPKNGESTTAFTANLNVFDNFFNQAQFGLTFRF